MIFILLNFLTFVLWLRMSSFLVSVSHELEKNVYAEIFGWNIL